MNQILIQDFLIVLPLVTTLISIILVSRLCRIDITTLVPFLTVTMILSFFILTPILTIPLFGVSGIFYVFIKVIDKNATLIWTYLMVGRKRSVAYLAIFALGSWLIFGGLLGTYLSYRQFHLSFRRAAVSYLFTLGLSSLLTWLFTLTVYHIFGSFL